MTGSWGQDCREGHPLASPNLAVSGQMARRLVKSAQRVGEPPILSSPRRTYPVVFADTHDNRTLTPKGGGDKRTGRYNVARLMETYGRDGALPDLPHLLTHECAKPSAPGARRCHAVYRRDW